MSVTRVVAWVLMTTLAATGTALAQDDEPVASDAEATGADAGADADDAPLDDDTYEGTLEDPDAPVLADDRVANEVAETAMPTGAVGYPVRVLDRPQTLGARMWRVSADLRLGGQTEKVAYALPGNDAWFRLGAVAAVDYGITNRVQVGVAYSPGTLADDEFETGKALALRGRYLVFDWLAVQVDLPLLVDPFNVALTLGAPVMVRVTERLGFFAGEDLLTIRITDFVPVVEDAVTNDVNVSAVQTNALLDDGDITIKGGALYQVSNQLAIAAVFGLVANDFSAENKPGAPLLFRAAYAATNTLDLGGQLGFMDLNGADHTFSLGVSAALRL